MRQASPNQKRLAVIAIVLVALVIGALQLGSDRSHAPELEPGAGWRVNRNAGDANALPMSERAGPTLAERQEGATREVALLAEELSADFALESLRAFDYGVKGSVTRSFLDDTAADMLRNGAERAWAPAGTIRAVDSEGRAVTDRFESGRAFELYGLAPGWWVIVIDTGWHGHVSANVLLTEGAPIANLDLELALPIQLKVEVALKTGQPLTNLEPGNVYLAAHTDEEVGPKTSWESLDLIVSGTDRLRWNDDKQAFLSAIWVLLPSDRAMNLSLFFGDRWIAARERKGGENSIAWELGPTDVSMELSQLEVLLADASTGSRLDYHVGTPHWDAKRADSGEVGKTTFLDVPPGWRTLHVSGGHHESREYRVYVGPGATVAETIHLHSGVRIGGSVISSDGDPVQTYLGAWLVDAESGKLAQTPTRIRWTSHHGEFAFVAMPPGTYMIRDLKPGEFGIQSGAKFPNYGTGLSRVEAAVDQEGLLIELLPLAHLVLELAQDPVGPLRWKIVDSGGVPVRQGQLKSIAPFRLTLAPGTYQLMTESAEGVHDSRALKLESGELRVII